MSMAQPSTIKSGDPRNDVSPSAPKGYSKFNLSRRFLQTHRFGEITPHCGFEVVKGDQTSMRLMNDTSSYSLKSPIKTDMFQKRSNFFVPLQAIIYNNWEYVVSQPNIGDDVPEDVDGVVSAGVINTLISDIVDMLKQPISSGLSTGKWMTGYLQNLILLEMFCSQGSLLKQLGYDFSHVVYSIKNSSSGLKYCSADAFIDHVLSKLAPVSEDVDGVHSFVVKFFDEDGNTTDQYSVVHDGLLSENPTLTPSGSYQYINYRHFLDLIRQNLNFIITSDDADNVTDDFVFGDFLVSSEDEGGETVVSAGIAVRGNLVKNINFDLVSAYQICCAHFFSIDHVDYIYSAQLYRQLMAYYSEKLLGGAETFTWNALTLNYDSLSGHMISEVMAAVYNTLPDPADEPSTTFNLGLAYLTALFSFRHSLRYLDYFTGGRTQPLSIGTSGNVDPLDPSSAVNVAVNNGAVNGVEMIIAQNSARLLNFSQRVGRKIGQWLKEMFPGGAPKPDMHDPQWLSTTGDALQPEQVQNTGALQAEDANSITARFKNDSNRYMFKVLPDRPGYIVCVTYYDVPRCYAFVTDKENMHCNRYDRFNPFMQYNGSQTVDKQEIGLIGDTPFSYQNRYEEYKQKPDICAGGFVENLPGFAFIADLQSGLPMQSNLNPTYVRSWNTELDPFYLALTGYCLASYFHFIVKNVNIVESLRPMDYQPQLL